MRRATRGPNATAELTATRSRTASFVVGALDQAAILAVLLYQVVLA